MAGSAPLPAFVHDHLPDSKTHIRLLQVLQGNFEQNVICTLSIWPLDSAPPYNAISYTWGDPSSTVDITVDGRNMVVRQNCEYVLQQAFMKKNKETQYLWVDAICVNQSEIQERGHQVALMGKLYKRAAHVFACVGARSDDLEFLFAICKKKRNLLKMISAAIRDLHTQDQWYHPVLGAGAGRRLVLRSTCTITPSTKLRIFKAFIAFLSRPYFTRVWILQELYMGTRVFFCCGTYMIPSGQMIAVSHLVDYWCNRCELWSLTKTVSTSISRMWAKWCKKEFENHMSQAYNDARPHRYCLSLAFCNQVAQSLDTVLSVIRQLQCSDERDRIYGILSLVDWRAYGTAPIPNYEISIFDLATETLGIIFDRSSDEYVFRCVDRLASVFNISGDSYMEYAKETRASATPRSPSSGWTTQSRSRLIEFGWYATKIDLPTSGPRSFARLCLEEPLDDNESTLLIDDNGVPFAQASAGTRVGDWYVHTRPDFPKPWDNFGLIARTAKNDSLTVIGLACTLGHHEHSLGVYSIQAEYLKMHWDPWDAFLLHLSVHNGMHNDRLHAVRNCLSESSSYATFIHPEMVGRDDTPWIDSKARKAYKARQDRWYTQKALEAYPAACAIWNDRRI